MGKRAALVGVAVLLGCCAPAAAEQPEAVGPSAVEVLDAAAARARIPGPEPWVVVLHTKWCAYCRRLLPEFDAAAAAVPDVRFGRIDCEAEASLCGGMGLEGYPTILFWPGGAASTGGLANSRQFRGPRTRRALTAFAADLAHPPFGAAADGGVRCREPDGDLREWAATAGVGGVAFLYVAPDAAAMTLFAPFAAVGAALHPEVTFACTTWAGLRATHAAGAPVAPPELDEPPPPTAATAASLADQLAAAGLSVGSEGAGGFVLRLSASEGARVLVALARSAPLNAVHQAMHAVAGAVQVRRAAG